MVDIQAIIQRVEAVGEKARAAARKVDDLNKALREIEDIAHFLSRVRLPFSGYVAALYSSITAWRAARVERQAQMCFERGWV